MPDSDPSAHALDVPGAQLYYERRGTGPLLLMIGSPMDSTGFAGLASALAGDYTMVTYDPRCIGNSSHEVTPAGAGGPDARHQRSVPRAFAPPDHVLPARHRGAEGVADADRGRPRGHVHRAAPEPHGGGTRRPARHDRGRLPR